jgi:sterol desaturase/sphingolipid hydroxylase (fatty acid hydroxylase superfamily)
VETYATALLIAIPLFSILILIEAVYGSRKGFQTLNSFDTISSLSSGMTNVIKDSLGVVLVIVSYPFVLSQLALAELPATWPVYLVAFVALDFAGYWSHRLNHSINFFWNNHVIHHSSEEFNLACALRQSISNLLGYYGIFLIPAALIGVPVQVINVLAPAHLFLQFWYHTRHVPKLGVLEYAIITPSQHRVHHAINPEYLDKNLGQIFPWWDRMFGTYQEELDDVEPVYGITRPVATWNPIRINFQHIWLLTKDAWRAESWWDKARIWFMPTGWRPPDVAERFPVHKIDDPYNFEKYGSPGSRPALAWGWFQFLSTTALLFLLLYAFGDLGRAELLVYAGFIFAAIFGYTSQMDGLPWAPRFESARGLIGLGYIFDSVSWFELGGAALTLAVAGYFLVTLVGAPRIARASKSSSLAATGI